MSWVLAEFRESLFEDIQEVRSFESSSILLARRDVNKDLIPKDQDKDKDLTPKDQDKNKDLKYVLKESLRTRTRTRTTARQIILIAHITLSNVQWLTCLSFIAHT